MSNSDQIRFCVMNDRMKDFERKIAYFFGVSNPEPIANAYTQALEKLEGMGTSTPTQLLEEKILPHLERAYKEIELQRGWNFDTFKAAKLELKIILGHVQGLSFEEIKNLMCELYTHVFQSQSPDIHKAAMLRTFLYQYKIALINLKETLSEEEMATLISLSNTSTELLGKIK